MPSKPTASSRSVSPEEFLSSCIAILSQMGEAGRYVWLHAKTIKDPMEQVGYLKMAIAHLREKSKERSKYAELPVDVLTFINSPLLLGMGDEVYPLVKIEIMALCSGAFVEAVLTGGIGTGKTTIALIAIAYALYELSCYHNPQGEFELARSSEILFVFQSLDAKKAKAIDFDRFKAMIDNSPYFQELWRYDRNLTSELRFPNRIIVKPLTGDVTAALGQNVFGGLMDEVNFMAVIENSKQGSDDTGVFDQARQIYRSINERRKSRFMNKGRLPGMLCMVSSKQYPGEFTDVKIAEREAEIAEHGVSTIFLYDKRIWEVKPDRFTGDWFHVFLGDESRKPRILETGEERTFPEKDQKLIMPIPMEYTASFKDDLLAAIREVAGMTTLALHPFIINIEAVRSCFGSVHSVLSEEWTDFTTNRLQVYPKRFQHLSEPRFVHIDPSQSVDSTGIAVGHVTGFRECPRGAEIEMLPVIQFDCLLEVRPPRNGEIIQENLRRVLYALRENGMLVKWVTMDGHQSLDSLQILAGRGFITGYKSMDDDNMPYETAKQALYDQRVIAPIHERALQEWTRLEKNAKTNKIDHPATGSKDITDAMAGVIYGLTMRRETWQRHGIPLSRVPKVLAVRQQKQEDKNYAALIRRERSMVRAQ